MTDKKKKKKKKSERNHLFGTERANGCFYHQVTAVIIIKYKKKLVLKCHVIDSA
jgi:hypothetical protein